MDNLILEKTDNTPGFKMSSIERHIEIFGESRPENAKLFFEPIFKWLEDYNNHLYYVANQSQKSLVTKIDFKLEYFNSSSAKFFIDIIKLLNKAESSNIIMDFNWHFELDDEDLKDAGMELMKMTKIKMNFVSY